MKRSKFVAVLLVFALAFGSISTAFASTDNTTLQKDTSERRATAKAGADTFIAVAAGAATSEATLTAVGSGAATAVAAATGITVSPILFGTIIVATTATAAMYAAHSIIDWIWE